MKTEISRITTSPPPIPYVPILAPVAFPLFPIVNGKCGCGNEKCARIGKHPMIAWGELKAGDPVPRPQADTGYGVKTGAAPKGSGIFVVDIDSEEAGDAFAAWLGYWPTTYTVETSKGWHLYFEHPGFRVQNSVSELLPGVDIRGDGGFVVGPGSPHKSGATYELTIDVAPATAPEKVLEWLRARPVSAEAQHHVTDCTDPAEREYRRKLYTKYLQDEAPARGPERRGKGDVTLFEVVQRGAYDLSLPTEDVLDLVREHYDPRCSPMWGDELEERVIHKSNQAKTKSTRPRAEPPPLEAASIFTLEAPPKPELPAPKTSTGIKWGAWDEPVPPIDWLIEPIIPKGTVGAFVAHGSSLKTWTEISIAVAISQGNAWLGKYTTKKGRVIIVDYESGLHEMRRRVRMLDNGRLDDLGVWCNPDLTINDLAFWKKLTEIPDVAIVCIDSLAAGSPGIDENAKEAAFPLQLANKYTEGTGAAVLFIHHSKKADEGDARKAVRGSTAIFAAMDWCYGFDMIEDTPAHVRMRVVCIKQGVGPKPKPFAIELTDAGLHMLEGSGTNEQEKLDDEMVASKIRLALSAGPLATEDEIRSATQIQNSRIVSALKAMIVRREVVKVPGLGYSLDGPDERKARVLAQVQGIGGRCIWSTEAQIAKAANVDTAVVLELLAAGVFCKSAEGRFFIPPPVAP